MHIAGYRHGEHGKLEGIEVIISARAEHPFRCKAKGVIERNVGVDIGLYFSVFHSP